MDKHQKKTLLKSTAGRWLLEAVHGKKRYVAAETLLQVLLSLEQICYSLLFREMIDRAVEHNKPGFFRALAFLACVALLRILLRAGIRRMNEFTCSKLENSLKERLFSRLLSRSYGDVTAVHTAQWMNRLTSDTVVVANGVAQIIPSLCGMAVKMAGAFIATYFFKGWIMNRIPGINKLKLRGVVSFAGIYGGLTKKNNPYLETNSGLYEFPHTAWENGIMDNAFDHNGYIRDGYHTSSPIGKLPYMELTAGFENIFKFIRIDYIRRLTYRIT